MRNDQFTIFFCVDIRKKLTSSAILCHILQSIANASHRLERLNSCDAVALPQITNLPPVKGRIKKDGMIVHAMSRREATLGSTFAIGELDNEQIRKLDFPVNRFTAFILTYNESRVFAQTIKKATNRNIRFFLRVLINLWLQSESTEIALFRPQLHPFEKMIGSRKPLLLTLGKTLITVAARNKDFVIRLQRETPNRAFALIGQFLVVGVDYEKGFLTHITDENHQGELS